MSGRGYQKLGLTFFDPKADRAKWDEANPDKPWFMEPPQEVWRTNRINTVLYCAGVGNRTNPDIMFIASSITEEEASQGFITNNGREVKDEAAMLEGKSGGIHRDLCAQAGIDLDKEYYTAVCKYLPPANIRGKLKKEHYAWGMPALVAEIPNLDAASYWTSFLGIYDGAFLVLSLWIFESLVIE